MLKGKLKSGTGNAVFRRTLVVVQFVLPAALISGALITSLAIGLMTVIYKAIRAASANPVDALKHE